MHTSAPTTTASRSRSRTVSVLLWLCTLVFALQVLGAGWHQHDLGEQHADCVSCHIAAEPATTPGTAPSLLAVFLAIAYGLARRPHTVHVAPPGYLRPAAQAPPRLN